MLLECLVGDKERNVGFYAAIECPDINYYKLAGKVMTASIYFYSMVVQPSCCCGLHKKCFNLWRVKQILACNMAYIHTYVPAQECDFISLSRFKHFLNKTDLSAYLFYKWLIYSLTCLFIWTVWTEMPIRVSNLGILFLCMQQW